MVDLSYQMHPMHLIAHYNKSHSFDCAFCQPIQYSSCWCMCFVLIHLIIYSLYQFIFFFLFYFSVYLSFFLLNLSVISSHQCHNCPVSSLCFCLFHYSLIFVSLCGAHNFVFQSTIFPALFLVSCLGGLSSIKP